MLHIRIYADQDGRPAPLALTFDSAVAQLETLPRMFIEPDGSFVWRGDGEEHQWDGELIDAGASLQCVSLKGQGSGAMTALRKLLIALQLDPAQLLIEQVMDAAWTRADQLLAAEGA